MPKRKTTDNDLNISLKALWFVMTAFIIIVFLLRIIGIYDLNAHIYDIELNKWQSYAACWFLYFVDVFIFLKIPTQASNKKVGIISLLWLIFTLIIWDQIMIGYLEFIFLLITPFVITKKWKVLVFTIILAVGYNLVQRLFVYSLLGTLTDYNKQDALMIICLLLYYQIYIAVSYLNIKILRRKKDE